MSTRLDGAGLLRSAGAANRLAGPLLACLVASGLAACGADKEKPATQVAARVNKSEVTVHQINHALQAQRGVRPDQAEQASSRILERLIDQELAVQKAESLKVDRDPKVMQQLAAMRAEIIAKAYFDKIAEGIAKPTPEEVTAYFNDNPALFRERRVYQLQEIGLQGASAQLEAVRRFVESGRSIDDLLVYLRSNNVSYTTNQVVRAAEQVPMANLPALAKLRNGQSLMITSANGAQVIAVVESRLQPIDEERARPAIEQFMVNERKRRIISDDVKALRSAAKVEYVGKFAASAAQDGEAARAATEAAAPSAQAAPAVAAPTAAPAAAASAPTPASSPALSTSIINKGLGLK